MAELKSWPVDFIPKREVVRSGLEYYGCEDFLRCKHCNATFGDWKNGDNPVEAHLYLAPECEFIQKVARTYRRPSSHRSDPPESPEEAMQRGRLASFFDFPAGIEIPHQSFAEAGFYYTGTGDTVACFYCGIRLDNWYDHEDPLAEHAYSYPNCHFIELVCGRKFIDSIKENPYKGTKRINIKQFDENSSVIKQFKDKCPECNENPKNACLIPCGHVVACEKCSELIIECKTCKKQVYESYRVYCS